MRVKGLKTGWPEKRIGSWKGLLSLSAAMALDSEFQPTIIYRGQADATWDMKPSLHRCLEPDVDAASIIALEAHLVSRFRSQAGLHLRNPQFLPTRMSIIDSWILMQHYQAPTRLLDWTRSFFVATYFAVESQPEKDGAVWCCNNRLLQSGLEKLYGVNNLAGNPENSQLIADAPNWVSVVEPGILTDRMVAQQAMISYCWNAAGNQQAIMNEVFEVYHADAPMQLIKFIIPKEYKPEFLQNLRTMNIAANTLFPGIDGFGRSLTELARLQRK